MAGTSREEQRMRKWAGVEEEERGGRAEQSKGCKSAPHSLRSPSPSCRRSSISAMWNKIFEEKSVGMMLAGGKETKKTRKEKVGEKETRRRRRERE